LNDAIQIQIAPAAQQAAIQQKETEEVVAQQMVQRAKEVVVNSEADFQAASQILVALREKRKALDDKRLSFTRPLRDVVNNINAFMKPPIALYEEAEKVLKNAMGDFKRRLAAAQMQAMAEAQKAIEQNNQQGFVTQMQTAAASQQPQAPGAHTRTTWKFRIVDFNAIPREFLMPDEAKIRAYVQSAKENASIPGIEVYPDENIVVRKT
jgi:hypothetical protein